MDSNAQLREEAQRISQAFEAARWRLESALSMQRKAQPSTGYRSTAKLGDAPWNTSAADAEVTAAYANLRRAVALASAQLEALYRADRRGIPVSAL